MIVTVLKDRDVFTFFFHNEQTSTEVMLFFVHNQGRSVEPFKYFHSVCTLNNPINPNAFQTGTKGMTLPMPGPVQGL